MEAQMVVAILQVALVLFPGMYPYLRIGGRRLQMPLADLEIYTSMLMFLHVGVDLRQHLDLVP